MRELKEGMYVIAITNGHGRWRRLVKNKKYKWFSRNNRKISEIL